MNGIFLKIEEHLNFHHPKFIIQWNFNLYHQNARSVQKYFSPLFLDFCFTDQILTLAVCASSVFGILFG